MSRNATLVAAIVVLAALSGVAAADPWGGFVADDEDQPGGIACFNPFESSVSFADCNDAVLGSLDSLVERAAYDASEIRASIAGPSEQARADQRATALATTYNTHADAIEGYVNPRFGGNASAYDVVRIDVRVGDATATRYLVADANGSRFDSSAMVNETDRTPDHRIGLSGFAGADAASELERFVTTYVEPDRDVDRSEFSRMANRYGGSVDLPEALEP